MKLLTMTEKTEEDFSYGEHFVPELEGAPEEEKSRLIQLRRIYLGEKLGKKPEEVKL